MTAGILTETVNKIVKMYGEQQQKYEAIKQGHYISYSIYYFLEQASYRFKFNFRDKEIIMLTAACLKLRDIVKDPDRKSLWNFAQNMLEKLRIQENENEDISRSSPIDNKQEELRSSLGENLDIVYSGMKQNKIINNEPITWYHGSPAELKLEELDINKTAGNRLFHKGLFITLNRQYAQEYINPGMSFANPIDKGFSASLSNHKQISEITDIFSSSSVVNKQNESNMVDKLNPVSSALLDRDNKGGIDFHAMPIVTQAINSPLNTFNTVSSGLIRDGTMDEKALNMEWLQIEKMVNAGIIPSAQRIKEYLVSSSLNGSFVKDTNKVFGCIAGILRLEEENLTPLEPKFKEVLFFLESM